MQLLARLCIGTVLPAPRQSAKASVEFPSSIAEFGHNLLDLDAAHEKCGFLNLCKSVASMISKKILLALACLLVGCGPPASVIEEKIEQTYKIEPNADIS